MTRVEKIESLLTQALSPIQLEVVDNSHEHAGHVGAKDGGGHFTVTIASPQFAGKNKIQCHQLVYKALSSIMNTDIHAVSIQIL